MSGSGGFSGGSHNETEVACDLLSFVTYLASPKHDVISSLKVGDFLDVNIVDSTSGKLVVAFYGENIAGGITSGKYTRLKRCLLEGFNYKAKVEAISQGNVTVRLIPSL